MTDQDREQAMKLQEATEDMIRMRQPSPRVKRKPIGHFGPVSHHDDPYWNDD